MRLTCTSLRSVLYGINGSVGIGDVGSGGGVSSLNDKSSDDLENDNEDIS